MAFWPILKSPSCIPEVSEREMIFRTESISDIVEIAFNNQKTQDTTLADYGFGRNLLKEEFPFRSCNGPFVSHTIIMGMLESVGTETVSFEIGHNAAASSCIKSKKMTI